MFSGRQFADFVAAGVFSRAVMSGLVSDFPYQPPFHTTLPGILNGTEMVHGRAIGPN